MTENSHSLMEHLVNRYIHLFGAKRVFLSWHLVLVSWLSDLIVLNIILKPHCCDDVISGFKIDDDVWRGCSGSVRVGSNDYYELNLGSVHSASRLIRWGRVQYVPVIEFWTPRMRGAWQYETKVEQPHNNNKNTLVHLVTTAVSSRIMYVLCFVLFFTGRHINTILGAVLEFWSSEG